MTTLELAFPCSYARNAVLTIGKPDIRETNCAEVANSSGDIERPWAASVGDVEVDVAGKRMC